MTINEYFDKVLFINLDRRTDRLERIVADLAKHGIEAERFEGRDMGNLGNHGCNASHKAVLELIVQNEWGRTLVLEDDNVFRYRDVQTMFSEFVEEVPEDWFLLYLSGHYPEVPEKFVSPHVIKFRYMKTTSAYGVKLESAREMAPKIQVNGTPIDEQFHQFSSTRPCYIFEPRLSFQGKSFSDLEGHVTNNHGCMTDTNHVAQIPPFALQQA